MSTEIHPEDMGRTTISVSDELADELYHRKGRGESYEDVIWRLVEQTQGREDSEPEARTEERPPFGTSENHPDPPAAKKTLKELVDDVADEVLPGSGEKLEARREALHAVVSYLSERGHATPGDFKDDVYPDYPAFYTEGEDPARSWWKNAMYKGLSEIAARSEEIEPADTSGEWSWIGGEDV